jgi:hypothetical protein
MFIQSLVRKPNFQINFGWVEGAQIERHFLEQGLHAREYVARFLRPLVLGVVAQA